MQSEHRVPEAPSERDQGLAGAADPSAADHSQSGAPRDGSPDRPEPSCPFLKRRPINADEEMSVCGAYRDRLVLGGRRLREVCETDNHRYCEYFLNPRVRA